MTMKMKNRFPNLKIGNKSGLLQIFFHEVLVAMTVFKRVYIYIVLMCVSASGIDFELPRLPTLK